MWGGGGSNWSNFGTFYPFMITRGLSCNRVGFGHFGGGGGGGSDDPPDLPLAMGLNHTSVIYNSFNRYVYSKKLFKQLLHIDSILNSIQEAECFCSNKLTLQLVQPCQHAKIISNILSPTRNNKQAPILLMPSCRLASAASL